MIPVAKLQALRQALDHDGAEVTFKTGSVVRKVPRFEVTRPSGHTSVFTERELPRAYELAALDPLPPPATPSRVDFEEMDRRYGAKPPW